MEPRAHPQLSISERTYVHLIAQSHLNCVSSSTAYSQEAAKTSMIPGRKGLKIAPDHRKQTQLLVEIEDFQTAQAHDSDPCLALPPDNHFFTSRFFTPFEEGPVFAEAVQQEDHEVAEVLRLLGDRGLHLQHQQDHRV
jgi:hypothetical protein